MTAPRGPDRRQQPRRHEDALLWYAEQNLLAAALVAVDGQSPDARQPAQRQLSDAAASYRYALARVEVARKVRNP